MSDTWFLFDLGNTVIKLAYERVLENICKDASASRDELVELFEKPGSYRDLERGAITFADFYEFICDRAGYRGSLRDFRTVWLGLPRFGIWAPRILLSEGPCLGQCLCFELRDGLCRDAEVACNIRSGPLLARVDAEAKSEDCALHPP